MTKWFSRKSRQIFWPFVFGLLIGVLLELLLINNLKKEKYEKLTAVQDKEIKISCLVLIRSQHFKNVAAAKQTWLKHCDSSLLVRLQKTNKLHPLQTCKRANSSQNFCPAGGAIDFLTITANNGWDSICQSLLKILEKDPDLQWLIILNDNLFVVLENLKFLVRKLDYTKNYYLGHPVNFYRGQYNVLSAGIVISRGSLLKLSEHTLKDCAEQGKYWNNEDIYLGTHLADLDITPLDTRDIYGRGRFHGYNIHNLLSPGKLFKKTNYYKNSVYPILEGDNCCSKYSVTFDGTEADKMKFHYYFLYVLKKVRNLKGKDVVLGQGKEDEWKSLLLREGFDKDSVDNVSAEEYFKFWCQKLMPPEEFYERLRKDVIDSKIESKISR